MHALSLRGFQIHQRRRQVRCREFLLVIMQQVLRAHACAGALPPRGRGTRMRMGRARQLMQHAPCAFALLCAQITTFATCLAQASTKDASYAAAMVALEQAEREVADCKISFPPRIAVIDRKMRIVSGRPRPSLPTNPCRFPSTCDVRLPRRQLDACMNTTQA